VKKLKIPGLEWLQSIGKPSYYNTFRNTISFDPNKEYAVIRSSICTGEKVAGFKNRENGHFTEVMLIRDIEDEKYFKKIYGIEKLTTEY